MKNKIFFGLLLILFLTIVVSCATKPKGLIDFSNVPESKYEIEKRRLAEIQRLKEQEKIEADANSIESSESSNTPNNQTTSEENTALQNNEGTSATSQQNTISNNTNSTNDTRDILKDFVVDSSNKTQEDNTEKQNEVKQQDTSPITTTAPSNNTEEEDTSNNREAESTLPNNGNTQTTTINEPSYSENSNKGYKETTVLFLPLKDTTISISLLSSRIRSMFAYDMPEAIVFTGVDNSKQNDITTFYGEYKAYNSENSVVLIKNGKSDSPIIGGNTRVLTFTTKEEYNEDDLNGILTVDPLYPNEYDSLYKTIDSYRNTPVILLASPNERSSQDFSSWSNPTRSDAESKWKFISNITDLGYFDVIENERWNSSSSGALHTDWTYKSDTSELRLDFMMLKNVAVEDAYTIDIADYSTMNGIKRRGILAHLVVEDETNNLL